MAGAPRTPREELRPHAAAQLRVQLDLVERAAFGQRTRRRLGHLVQRVARVERVLAQLQRQRLAELLEQLVRFVREQRPPEDAEVGGRERVDRRAQAVGDRDLTRVDGPLVTLAVEVARPGGDREQRRAPLELGRGARDRLAERACRPLAEPVPRGTKGEDVGAFEPGDRYAGVGRPSIARSARSISSSSSATSSSLPAK
ncbi:MAG: hypothetical protein ICV64_00655 [Thermoleophilia bacterium]|nr:hypothetical protein [Thermoleophilia bacterium]